MKLRATVARNLRRFRNQRELTQEELAARAGFYRNYVGMLEREENSPTVDTLEKLAAVLGVSPKLFFEDVEHSLVDRNAETREDQGATD